MTSAPDKTQPGISSTDTAGNSSAQFLRSLKISRSCIITSAVLFILMIFVSDIDGMITGSLDFTYAFGCGLVNYSAGFIRRGLLGEILCCNASGISLTYFHLLRDFIQTDQA